MHGAIGFGLACHWLKNWHESFKPITKRANRNHVMTFDSHLKIYSKEQILITPSFQFFSFSTAIWEISFIILAERQLHLMKSTSVFKIPYVVAETSTIISKICTNYICYKHAPIVILVINILSSQISASLSSWKMLYDNKKKLIALAILMSNATSNYAISEHISYFPENDISLLRCLKDLLKRFGSIKITVL